MSLRVPSDSTLTPTQRRFLDIFFGAGDSAANFCLGGGTALAGFHLRHRYSDDIDLFTYERASLTDGLQISSAAIATIGLTLVQTDGVPSKDDLIRLSLEGDAHPDHPLLKVELIRDTLPVAGPPDLFDGIRVMGIRDIAASKLLTLGVRMEPRDFVDLYFISEEGGIDLMEILPLAIEKGPGISNLQIGQDLWNVHELRDVKKYLDRYAVKPVSFETLTDFCRQLARKIFDLYGRPSS